MTEQTSPLTEATANSIQDLFNKNPEELSELEIISLIKELRLARGKWQIVEQAKLNKEKKEKVSLAKGDIDDLLKGL